jgi:hypothetical protein
MQRWRVGRLGRGKQIARPAKTAGIRDDTLDGLGPSSDVERRQNEWKSGGRAAALQKGADRAPRYSDRADMRRSSAALLREESEI